MLDSDLQTEIVKLENCTADQVTRKLPEYKRWKTRLVERIENYITLLQQEWDQDTVNDIKGALDDLRDMVSTFQSAPGGWGTTGSTLTRHTRKSAKRSIKRLNRP